MGFVARLGGTETGSEEPTNGSVAGTVNHFGEGYVVASDEIINPRLGGF